MLKTLFILVFDVDEVLFKQKNDYIKNIKFNEVTNIGILQNTIIEQLKTKCQVYVIGLTKKDIEEKDIKTLNEKLIYLDLIISKSKEFNNINELQKRQINLVRKLGKKYNIRDILSIVNNKKLYELCLQISSFTPSIDVYNNQLVLIPIIYMFVLNCKCNN